MFFYTNYKQYLIPLLHFKNNLIFKKCNFLVYKEADMPSSFSQYIRVFLDEKSYCSRAFGATAMSRRSSVVWKEDECRSEAGSEGGRVRGPKTEDRGATSPDPGTETQPGLAPVTHPITTRAQYQRVLY